MPENLPGNYTMMDIAGSFLSTPKVASLANCSTLSHPVVDCRSFTAQGRLTMTTHHHHFRSNHLFLRINRHTQLPRPWSSREPAHKYLLVSTPDISRVFCVDTQGCTSTMACQFRPLTMQGTADNPAHISIYKPHSRNIRQARSLYLGRVFRY